ncbi:MAG: hypothetical protein KIT27_08600 [Legionellales bacterium]|nr:hypothetical protein [Legionellales bacterium]
MEQKIRNYHDYLNLDNILNSQTLASSTMGANIHDEMLFMITHQTYELWFKQILHELNYLLTHFFQAIDQQDLLSIHQRLQRIMIIQKLLLQQFSVINTMDVIDFIDFRQLLTPASGMQSVQFKLLEISLGRKNITINPQNFTAQQLAQLNQAKCSLSLYEGIEQWLNDFSLQHFSQDEFLNNYAKVIDTVITSSHSRAANIPWQLLFDKTCYEQAHKQLSWDAFVSGIYITSHQHQPTCHLPYLILQDCLEVDALFQAWRCEHLKLVLRMMGQQHGTGGTTGAEYLAKQLENSPIFAEFYAFVQFIVPTVYHQKIFTNQA